MHELECGLKNAFKIIIEYFKKYIFPCPWASFD